MGWLTNHLEKKIDKLSSNVHFSFRRVSQDVENLFQWINYFYAITQEQNSRIFELKRKLSVQEKTIRMFESELESMPKNSKEVILEKFDGVESLKQRIFYIENRLSSLEKTPKPSGSNIREKIVNRLVRNSKKYIQNFLFSLISKYGEISSLKLRDIVVDEQGLCSKSSFYRILGELESRDNISVLTSGREKVFVMKASALT